MQPGLPASEDSVILLDTKSHYGLFTAKLGSNLSYPNFLNQLKLVISCLKTEKRIVRFKQVTTLMRNVNIVHRDKK